eukprot:gene686-1047_t
MEQPSSEHMEPEEPVEVELAERLEREERIEREESEAPERRIEREESEVHEEPELERYESEESEVHDEAELELLEPEESELHEEPELERFEPEESEVHEEPELERYEPEESEPERREPEELEEYAAPAEPVDLVEHEVPGYPQSWDGVVMGSVAVGAPVGEMIATGVPVSEMDADERAGYEQVDGVERQSAASSDVESPEWDADTLLSLRKQLRIKSYRVQRSAACDLILLVPLTFSMPYLIPFFLLPIVGYHGATVFIYEYLLVYLCFAPTIVFIRGTDLIERPDGLAARIHVLAIVIHLYCQFQIIKLVQLLCVVPLTPRQLTMLWTSSVFEARSLRRERWRRIFDRPGSPALQDLQDNLLRDGAGYADVEETFIVDIERSDDRPPYDPVQSLEEGADDAAAPTPPENANANPLQTRPASCGSAKITDHRPTVPCPPPASSSEDPDEKGE